MAIKIPANFNFKAEPLDPNETYIRDRLNLNIENWAKFRYTIHVGNDSRNLNSLVAVSNEIKSAYRELAKSHYEVVCSLGYSCVALTTVQRSVNSHLFQFQKSSKDFYFHIGCLLDNFGRLIYVLNNPNSPSERKSRNSPELKRHWMDWGTLMRDHVANPSYYVGYNRFFQSSVLQEIINVRNAMTHYWRIPFRGNSWPNVIKSRKALPWPYDEPAIRRYKKWIPIVDFTRNHFDFIHNYQNQVFARLIKDVKKFERNHNLTII